MKVLALAIILSFVLVGCANRPSSSRNDIAKQFTPQDKLTIDASGVLLKRLLEGHLPGFVKDEHGNIKNDPCDCDSLFPAVRTFHVTKRGETVPYNYTFVRASEGSEWQLQRAWITNRTSHMVEELSK